MNRRDFTRLIGLSGLALGFSGVPAIACKRIPRFSITMLVHFNLLNALFLGDLIAMFIKKGWIPIEPELAYGDPIFASQPKVLPAGESLIWSLAKEKKTLAKSLRYPAEDSRYEAARMKRLGL